MTWGLSSYETRFRWIAALWAILMTIWCMSPLPWRIRLMGGGVWIAITVLASIRFAWWRPRSARDVPIFLSMGAVSDVVTDAHPAARTVRPSELEALIRNLLSAGYRFQTAREALTAPARKAVALVIDGGTRDVLTVLLPLLRRLGVKATCCVPHHETGDPAYLKPLELQEVARSGMVEFGGRLEAAADSGALHDILTRNRDWLTGILGTLPYVCLYPECLRKDATLHAELQEAGYHAALFETAKTHPTVAAPFAIPCRALPRGLRHWQAYLLATRGRWRAF